MDIREGLASKTVPIKKKNSVLDYKLFTAFVNFHSSKQKYTFQKR